MPSEPNDEDVAALVTPLYAIATGIHRVVSSKPAVTRVAMLQAVAHSGSARPSDIATELRLHQPQVSHQVQTLADEGLLEITTDPGDRRSRLLRLTEAGQAEVARLTDFGLTRWRGFLGEFDVDEVRELGRLLAKLQHGLAHSNNGPTTEAPS